MHHRVKSVPWRLLALFTSQQQCKIGHDDKGNVTFIMWGLLPLAGKHPDLRQGTRARVTKGTITREGRGSEPLAAPAVRDSTLFTRSRHDATFC